MYAIRTFTADVGTFNTKGNKINLNSPTLRIPIVGRTYIGRAADPQEQALCDGYMIARFKDPAVEGEAPVKFYEKPSFNGSKIIIPQLPDKLTNWISRLHGELSLRAGDKAGLPHLDYRHLSKSGMMTSRWNPNYREAQGFLDCTNAENSIMHLFPVDDYLLFGGNEGTTPEERFPRFSYYVRITFLE